jgi:putative ABC transport system substrate-binding protein
LNPRRQVLIALGLGTVAVSLRSLAQPERRVRRIGFFAFGSSQGNVAYLAAFRKGLSELGWTEGRDYLIDGRYADGAVQVREGLAAELVANQPDLLLSTADAAVRVLAQRTKTIPIVFAIGQDPVGNGIVASLQHPGGNATGLTNLARVLGAKRLQLLKEAFPQVARVVLLFEPTDVGSVSQVKEIEEAAARLGMRIIPIELRQTADIDSAFKRGSALGVQAYMVAQGFFINMHLKAIVDRSLRSKVPAIFGSDLHAKAGGLMSYSPSPEDNFRRAAAYVDKIFKGAKPGDLPIEQPIKIELVINLRTARALKLEIPQSILLRADKVIE